MENVIKSNGFNINKSKTRLQSSLQRQVVTGIIVNKKLNLPRDYIKNIRALLFRWEKDGEEKADKHYRETYKNCSLRKVLLGRISYIKLVRGENDPIYIKLWNKYHILIGQPEKIKALISEDREILEIISKGENNMREFKQAFLFSQDEGKCNKTLYYCPNGSSKEKPTMKHKVLRAVCSFLNSNTGGSVFLGVADNSQPVGLKEDLNYANNNLDKLALSITNSITDCLSPSPIGHFNTKFYKLSNNKIICKIDVLPYVDPVYLNTRGGILYVRNDVQSIEIKEKAKIDNWIRVNNKLQR